MAKMEKLTDHQREEIAHFVEKMKTLIPSEQQEHIFERARTGTGRYVINAGPGSGKTTTAIKLSTYFTDSSSIYLAYNKKIQMDTTRKLNALGSKMIASTVHSFGLQCINTFFGPTARCQIKDSKYEEIIDSYMARHWNSFFESIRTSLSDKELEKSNEWIYDAKIWSRTLVKYHQLSLCGLDPDSLKALIEQFDLTDINPKARIWPFVLANVHQAIEEGKQQFWDNHIIDFNDMIYYPVTFGEIPIPTYKHIIVDEAQDTSETALTLIMQACNKDTQIFAVGDPRQSIYVFAGAKETSIPDIIHSLNAEVLPLRTCYRCGSRIVDLANQLDGQLVAAGRHEGTVNVVESELYLEQLQPKDAVIGRTTARLVKDCLKVLQTGKRALVLGKNIGDSISGIITKIEARRINRGIPALDPHLTNFIELLDQHKEEQTKIINETRKKNPELAVSELQDKADTARAFFEAYIAKCIDPTERREADPKCEYDQTARDFKKYIRGLFTDNEDTNIIQFMTAHRSKGLEFDRVFIIGTEEFPHPKAKSDQQLRQETNIMYVAITRAINDLYFVDAPFTSITIPGYEQGGITIAANASEIGTLTVYPYDDKMHHDEIQSPIYIDANEQPIRSLFPGTHDLGLDDKWEKEDNKEVTEREQEKLERAHLTLVPSHATHKSEPVITEELKKQDAFIGKFLAIEVLCPNCGNDCANPKTGSIMITEDLIGHTVTCVECHTESLVPLNAFMLAGNVVAREKPLSSGTNNKAEKRGRTEKPRKSNAGRKTKSGVVRQPRQLSLDVRTIQTLDAMGANNSQLFETLLNQYEPFLNTWAELGYASSQEDEEE